MALLRPDRYVQTVADLDPAQLADEGVRLVLLDMDNTIVPRDTGALRDDARQWITELQAKGIEIALVSNNWAKNVRPIAREIGAVFISRSAKPLPIAFILLRTQRKLTRAQTIVVGDQLFTDMLGAKLAGLRGMMVLPQAKKDLAHTLALRPIEAWFMGHMRPEGNTDHHGESDR